MEVKEMVKIKSYYEGFVIAEGRKILSNGKEFISGMEIKNTDITEKDWKFLVTEGTIVKKLIEVK